MKLINLRQLKNLKLTGKNFLLVLSAGALIGLIGYFFWGGRAGAAEYTTARIERGNLRNTVTATGTLQAVTTVQVGSQASGTISALYADFNSTVTRGQVIAQLDPSVTQAQVQQSRANLEQARAGLEQSRAGLQQSRAGLTDAQAKVLVARSTVQNQQAGVSGAQANLAVLQAQREHAQNFLRQQETLARGGVISQQEYQTAQTEYRTAEARYNQAAAQLNQAQLTEQSSSSAGIAQAQAQVQQAQAQVQQAQANVRQAEAQVQQATASLQLAGINLTQTTIRSPIDGVVVSRDVDVGQTVAASMSAPTLFTIAQDLSQMQVFANIDQADIALVERAKGVSFTVDAFPGAEFRGEIQQIRLNPQNTQNVVTYNVVIDVSNPEQKLKPGMTADLAITVDERSNVLKVPNAALRFTPPDAEELLSARAQGEASDAGNENGAAGQPTGARRGARRQTGNENREAGAGGAAGNATQPEGARARGRVASPASAAQEGQSRVVWVMGQDGKPAPRRIRVGLTDGTATEVLAGNLQEGETVITGQTVESANRSAQSNQQQQTAPGFGGAQQRGGGVGGAGGGRRR